MINLVVNARDAMPAGGRLTIQTESVTLGAESMNLDPKLSPGGYVKITVSDYGFGMTSDVAVRAFEPFFTTKSVGEIQVSDFPYATVFSNKITVT